MWRYEVRAGKGVGLGGSTKLDSLTSGSESPLRLFNPVEGRQTHLSVELGVMRKRADLDIISACQCVWSEEIGKITLHPSQTQASVGGGQNRFLIGSDNLGREPCQHQQIRNVLLKPWKIISGLRKTELANQDIASVVADGVINA